MAYQALYRKYRPETFEDMVGQQAIIRTLRNAISKDRIAHAYLFSGPRGTGKTSTAKIFARMLECEKDPLHPCGECPSCQMALQGNHPDIIEIDAASNNGVDEVRSLIDRVKYAPMEGKYKVYIIDEVHMMTTGAFNALLKTIEEPPAHVIFILATTEPNKVLPTILSRCQRFDFSRVSQSDIVKRLETITEKEDITIDPEALNLIARLADGGMRDSLSILDQCVAYEPDHIKAEDVRAIYGIVTREDIAEIFDSLYHERVDELISKINSIAEEGMDLKRFTADFIRLLKNSLIVSLSPDTVLVSEEEKELLKKWLVPVPQAYRMAVMENLIQTYNQYGYASSILDYLEAGLLKSIGWQPPVPVQPQIKASAERRTQKSEQSHEFKAQRAELPPQKTGNSKTTQNAFTVPDNNVSRETFTNTLGKSSETELKQDFILQLMAGGIRKQRAEDSRRFKNLRHYTSDPTHARSANALIMAKIVASGENYLLVQVKTKMEAAELNSLQEQFGFEDFLEELLGSRRKLFAISEKQNAEALDEFRKLMAEKKLPKPAVITLERTESQETREEESLLEKLKDAFPALEVIDD